jgi:hypothetical protein
VTKIIDAVPLQQRSLLHDSENFSGKIFPTVTKIIDVVPLQQRSLLLIDALTIE